MPNNGTLGHCPFTDTVDGVPLAFTGCCVTEPGYDSGACPGGDQCFYGDAGVPQTICSDLIAQNYPCKWTTTIP
jgi:hypothetical protein